jgi:hypothetical protein
MNTENLGPAERILETVLQYTDHLYHNRPGMIVPGAPGQLPVWSPVFTKVEEGQTVVYQRPKPVSAPKGKGKKAPRIPPTKIGVLREDGKRIVNAARDVGEYRKAGIFPEVATWMYQQIANVWSLDHEFAARWASHAYAQDHRDLKVVLAAFMLVQSRRGDPIRDQGKIVFRDEDFRNVGEAMMLLYRKDGKDLNPKLLIRIHNLLRIPAIAQINQDLKFGASARHPFLGRWPLAAEKWLRHREQNLSLLKGLVSAGFRRSVMRLAHLVRFRPEDPKFFEVLRWRQAQAKDGRRSIAIGTAVKAAETWAGLTEAKVCEKVLKEKPNWKRLTSLLPVELVDSRAVFAAAIEAGSLSDKDLIIATPTLEARGLLQDKDVRARWEKAVKSAEDMRSANIATRVRSTEIKEALKGAEDAALQKAVAEVAKQIAIRFFIDISGSMTEALPTAKRLMTKIIQAFDLKQVKVAVFDQAGREVEIKHRSSAGVEQAFLGIRPGGATDYGAGVLSLSTYPAPPGHDLLMFFVGDGRNYNKTNAPFADAVRRSNLHPTAFAFLHLGAPGQSVESTAVALGIPCFRVDEKQFEGDVYAIPRMLRDLIAATPVNRQADPVPLAPARLSLVQTILKTELLAKPTWAA